MGRRYSIKGRRRHYVVRDKKGRFKKWVGKGRSLSRDRRRKAKRTVKSGYGHRGDQKVRSRKRTRKKLTFSLSTQRWL